MPLSNEGMILEISKFFMAFIYKFTHKKIVFKFVRKRDFLEIKNVEK